MNELKISIQNQELRLLPQKVLYWENKSALILSDIHLGKSGHFQKAGIPIPTEVNQSNLEKLEDLINSYSPKVVYVLGDLFHSLKNKEWVLFKSWRSRFTETKFVLIAGNHDIYTKEHYIELDIEYHKTLELYPFIFTHEPYKMELNQINNELFQICGHIHPAVKIKGKGRQYERVPIFYHQREMLILPSFGAFTGSHLVQPNKDDQLYAIVGNEVLPL